MASSGGSSPRASTEGSLTPAYRNEEATELAFHEGLMAGGMTLLPTMGAVYIAMQNNKTFLARTNWQSRTAITIMPAVFAFAWTAEHSLMNKMKDMAKEAQHSSETVEWAERRIQEHLTKSRERKEEFQQEQLKTQQLQQELYTKSVLESGVCIVPGDTLGVHHKVANFVSANPIKFLAAMAVPSVAWILYGNTGKQNLTFSIALLHTRVFGQFATISLLLGVMGFKEFMDQNGKFITQAEADARVEDMKHMRESLMQRLEMEKQLQLEQEQAIAEAHAEDIREHNVHTRKKNKKGKKKDHTPAQEVSSDSQE